ncbi:MAG: hypothetical protein NC489_42885 [Ruminococcus flavefaciens]|nr:hypothetical protein [Ruminococcus flavefaciens]
MNILFSILTVLFIALLVVFVVAYFKEKKLDEIRLDVYKLFLKAEHSYKESGQGKQKMKWVIQRARQLLPAWLQIIVTEEVFEKLIQIWFDGIKDLLDDGKINCSNNS